MKILLNNQVSKKEREIAKSLMRHFRLLKKSVADYEKHELSNIDNLSGINEQEQQYKLQLRLMQHLERAIEFIEDPEEREIIEQRFCKGYTYKQLIIRHSCMDASTVIRKMNKALDVIAARLKEWGMFEDMNA